MQKLNLHTAGYLVPCFAPARPANTTPHHRRHTCHRVSASSSVAENGAAVRNGLDFQIQDVFPPAEPKPVSPEVQAILDEQGLDYETSGLKYLTNEARVSTNSALHKPQPVPGPFSVATAWAWLNLLHDVCWALSLYIAATQQLACTH